MERLANSVEEDEPFVAARRHRSQPFRAHLWKTPFCRRGRVVHLPPVGGVRRGRSVVSRSATSATFFQRKGGSSNERSFLECSVSRRCLSNSRVARPICRCWATAV